ncbi:MAG: tetratricopeptide repeat protein [Paludibacter sp.]|jgi:tetratricopeptide (TPR) repeat protein|nr:tetratricopeptide repeat protein [Paludibacter sp.]
MKKIFIVFSIFYSLTTFSQTVHECYKSGITKHKQLDYKGAIKDYSSAIKANNLYEEAYFNRGICELKLKDYNAALKDFTKIIEIDATYPKAYYNRATVYIIQKKYAKALLDLDKTIKLDITIPNALTLRGQIRYIIGDKAGAIEDFDTAKQIGDKHADEYLAKYRDNELQIDINRLFDHLDSKL